MKAIITTVTSLLVTALCHGAELLGVSIFEPVPIVADWHPPLLPPELLPPRPNPPPVARASSHPLDGSPATILGVSRSADKRSLTVQYELSGRTNELQIVLTNGIAEFHFCSWVMGRGIALTLSTTSGEVYWAASYFAGRKGPIYPIRLSSPPGYSLLGIVNNRGDSIIISAVAHDSERGRASGWMYFNGCPPGVGDSSHIPTNQIKVSGFEHLVMLEIPPTKSETTK